MTLHPFANCFRAAMAMEARQTVVATARHLKHSMLLIQLKPQDSVV